jgi:hypothetical protein
VEPAYLPAPACLLAFAAWRAGDGVLARIAVQRALAADPGYPLATLVQQLIHHGVTASTVDEWLRQGVGS